MARRGDEDDGRAWAWPGPTLTIVGLLALYLLPLFLSWCDGEVFPSFGFNQWIGSHPRLRNLVEWAYTPLIALIELWRNR